MKTKLLSLSAVAFSLALVFYACKKDSSGTSGTDYTAEMTAQSDDQSQVSSSLDLTDADANAAIASSSTMNGKVESAVCNATVTIDTASDPRTITIVYNGSDCFGTTTRTGTVILSMPHSQHWTDAGATLTITYQNLKITRTRDSKSITINGSKSITNVSGGTMVTLASRQSITHTITSNGITITFDNGTQGTWQIAEQRVFTYNNGIVVTTTGTHTDGTTTGIAIWGKNRLGNVFTCAITQPLVLRQDCNFRLVSGQVVHTRVGAFTATITFGLDATGVATSCPGTGNYYFKAVWVSSTNVTKTVILPY